MARKPDNSGWGLMAICILLILAIAKCGGGAADKSDSTPSGEPSEAMTETAPEAVTMYVTTATLNCRAEPQKNARAVEKLTRGDTVSAGETRGSWVMLDRVGEDCWVAQRFLSESEPEPEPAARPARLLSSASSEPLEAVSSRRSGPSCGGKWKCGQMDSCAEAYHYLNECGVGRLDGDGDGVPCESIC
ncbi:excalibur calcium-binding domain-containing protein [Sphingobium sp. TCM1]|uniref:excalibur calcium-binding domain-containing protein n=1 Tax=Sphingobium sp. TCM1 TaxID=453246 RepID=UPI000A90E3AD|nr:excalibur calcium-binding domain-containing protein [Sphingobium sp. TCM1]